MTERVAANASIHAALHRSFASQMSWLDRVIRPASHKFHCECALAYDAVEHDPGTPKEFVESLGRLTSTAMQWGDHDPSTIMAWRRRVSAFE
jgi:hypothetical protein